MKKLDVQINQTEEKIKKIDQEIADLKKELDRNHQEAKNILAEQQACEQIINDCSAKEEELKKDFIVLKESMQEMTM